MHSTFNILTSGVHFAIRISEWPDKWLQSRLNAIYHAGIIISLHTLFCIYLFICVSCNYICIVQTKLFVLSHISLIYNQSNLRLNKSPISINRYDIFVISRISWCCALLQQNKKRGHALPAIIIAGFAFNRSDNFPRNHGKPRNVRERALSPLNFNQRSEVAESNELNICVAPRAKVQLTPFSLCERSFPRSRSLIISLMMCVAAQISREERIVERLPPLLIPAAVRIFIRTFRSTWSEKLFPSSYREEDSTKRVRPAEKK